jgi:small neutral amino acid transporter SnatA (MarC family)
MSEGLLQFGLTAFVTLFVVIDPLGVVPIFVSLTEGREASERRAIGTRAVMIAPLTRSSSSSPGAACSRTSA